LLPALTVDESVQLSVVAGASLDIGPGNVVAVIPAGELTLTLATADVVTGNPALGLAGTLADANVLAFTITGADLFVGTGGALNLARTAVVTTGAKGFSAVGASVTSCR